MADNVREAPSERTTPADLPAFDPDPELVGRGEGFRWEYRYYRRGVAKLAAQYRTTSP